MIKKSISFTLTGLMTFAALTSPLEAAYTFRDGKIVDAKLCATMSLEDHYNAGVEAFCNNEWYTAARQFGIASANFPLSPYGQLAAFYQGVSNYNMTEYDLADQAFSAYLEGKSNPELFELAIEYKFSIAEQFRHGARRRLLGTRQLPKWASAYTNAIKIYEEIIAVVPSSEIAVQSLFSKALMHWSERQYNEAVESFQMIIRRFPKHELTPESYLMINRVYLDQAKWEFQNSDLLAFAEINARRFALAFPREERLEEAERGVLEIKEVYARGLFETGLFYHKIGYPKAAILYFRTTIMQFPDTEVANLCRTSVAGIGYTIPQSCNDLSESESDEYTDQQAEMVNDKAYDESESQKELINWIQ